MRFCFLSDITISTIEVIRELTEDDAFFEDESALALPAAIVQEKGIETLFANLGRLDEDKDEEQQTIFSIYVSIIFFKPIKYFQI